MRGALFVFALILSPFRSEARVAEPKDLPSWVEFISSEISVNKDGTSTSIQEIQIHIENETGRTTQSVQSLLYRPLNDKLELLEAYTLNDGKKLKVEKNNISIESGGNNRPGFDAEDKMIIAFPQVETGSSIYYRVKLSTFSIPEPGFYSFFDQLYDIYVKKFHLHIRSDLPLFSSVRDPYSLLKLKESRSEDGKYIVDLTNQKPIQNGTVEEEQPFTAEESVPSINISTLELWNKFAPKTLVETRKMLKEKVPKNLADIASSLSRRKTSAELVNDLTARLTEKVRYFGDWRRVRGDYLPRTLKEISTTLYGDCKDLSFVTAVLLRQLGFTADIAWVFRGDQVPLKSQYNLPNGNVFNHAVVRAEKEGMVFWVDATNTVSQAPYVPYDIAGRYAFVLSSSPHLEFIPEVSASEAKYENKVKIASATLRAAKVEGEFTAKGLAAEGALRALIANSTAENDFQFIAYFQPLGVLRDYKISAVNDKSRILHDYSRNYRAHYDEFWVDSTAGYSFEFSIFAPLNTLFTLDARTRHSDLHLGVPYTFQNSITFVGRELVGAPAFTCSVKSRWVDINKSIAVDKKTVQVQWFIQFNRRTLTRKEILTKEFSQLQMDLRECYSRRQLIFKN